MRQITCAILVVFAALETRADARTISNAELNFTLVVPDRLKPLAPPRPGMGPDTVAAFATSDQSHGLPDATVSITRMHGVIGREHLDPSKTPVPGVAGARVRQQKWKTFDIDVIEGEVARGNVHMATRMAQVPLKGEAIQVGVAVPLGKEDLADALLSELLAGLDGSSNWLTDEEREDRLARNLGRLTAWAVALVVIFVLVIRAYRKRSRPSLS